MAPLMDIDRINDRLDSVQDIMNYSYEMDLVSVKLAKLPDMEKLLAKIFTYSIKHKVKAIYFEDVSLVKMKEFRQLLKTLRSIPEVFAPMMNRISDFKSERLKELLSNEGMFPENLIREID
jgi:DNA mismatch repair protein MSH6